MLDMSAFLAFERTLYLTGDDVKVHNVKLLI